MEIKMSIKDIENIKPLMYIDTLESPESARRKLEERKLFRERLLQMKRGADANYTHSFVSVDEVLEYL